MSTAYHMRFTALILAFLCVGFSESAKEPSTCKYHGDKDKSVYKTLNSKGFQSLLSPFAKIFLRAIPSEDYFFKLFDVSFNPSTAERDFFLLCVNFNIKMGLKCPIKICKTFSQQANSAIQHSMTRIEYFLAIANILEKDLTKSKELKEVNSSETEEKVKELLSNIGEYLCDPDVKGAVDAFFALCDGSSKFFKSKGVISPKVIAFFTKAAGEQYAKIGPKPVVVDVTLELFGRD